MRRSHAGMKQKSHDYDVNSKQEERERWLWLDLHQLDPHHRLVDRPSTRIDRHILVQRSQEHYQEARPLSMAATGVRAGDLLNAVS